MLDSFGRLVSGRETNGVQPSVRFSNLQLRQFRNIERATLELSSGINVFMGRNGQGKTSALEALYLLAGFRSFRGAKNRELVRQSELGASLEAAVVADEVERQVRVVLEGAKKTFLIDGKEPGSLAEWIGRLVVVTFSPDDLFLVKGEPELRRRWLDRVIFLLRPSHLTHVMGYQKALKARNALLRDGRLAHASPTDLAVLDAFDAALARYGSLVAQERKAWLSQLKPLVEAEYRALTNGERECVVGSAPGIEAQTFDEYCRALGDKRSNDVRRGKTSLGVHLDDMTLQQGGAGARQMASQGEQRAMTLALKLAEVLLLERERQVSPVLLLDDVAGELDRERNVLLYRQLERASGQVFIAGTDLSASVLERLSPGAVFQVENGTFSKQN